MVGRRSLNLELNPYVLAGAVQDTCGVSGCQTDVKRDVGLIFKLSVMLNPTLDLTYNTDFSQVEADEQQINFTRFNLFFPEKRQFFLEGKGIFDFGITTGDYLLLPFFSRRIGLERDRAVPILGGARLTGKAGNYSVGALAIRTEEAAGVPDTNFSVVRVRRDVLRRSSIGFIATDRRGGSAQNEEFRAPMPTSPSAGNAKVESFVARAWSPGREADSWAGRLRAANEGDRFTAEVDLTAHRPELLFRRSGSVRRRDVDRWFTRVQASPRPRRGPVRKVFGGASFDYVRNGAGRLESRDAGTFFKLEFHSADLVEVTVTRRHDAPPTAFEIGGLSVAAGSDWLHGGPGDLGHLEEPSGRRPAPAPRGPLLRRHAARSGDERNSQGQPALLCRCQLPVDRSGSCNRQRHCAVVRCAVELFGDNSRVSVCAAAVEQQHSRVQCERAAELDSPAG